MAEALSYVILGAGRWARTIYAVLAAEHSRTTCLDQTRRLATESEAAYKSRLAGSMSSSGAQIAWICAPPGAHIPLIIEAAIGAGLHVVVEKPWKCSRHETDSLLNLARAKRLFVAIHYQYCFLAEVENWRRKLDDGVALRFGGHFVISRPNRLAIPAIENLGSHLLAIRAHAVPHSAVSEIRCAYEQPDERYVWVEKQDGNIAAIDFLGTREPVIQRFMASFEAALGGSDFPFGLDFADRVSEDVVSVLDLVRDQ